MKILIVDDIKGWRDYHKSVMAELFTNGEFFTADSAKSGYDKIIENCDTPFDVVITDMQMELDFEPKYAGEWLIEQIKSLKNYTKTKIVIISAAYNIEHIANFYNVEYIRKNTARIFPDVYKSIL